MGCHCLLRGIFLTQGSNPGLPHCRQTLYHLSHLGSPKYPLLASIKENLHPATKIQHSQKLKKKKKIVNFRRYILSPSLHDLPLTRTPSPGPAPASPLIWRRSSSSSLRCGQLPLLLKHPAPAPPSGFRRTVVDYLSPLSLPWRYNNSQSVTADRCLPREKKRAFQAEVRAKASVCKASDQTWERVACA